MSRIYTSRIIYTCKQCGQLTEGYARADVAGIFCDACFKAVVPNSLQMAPLQTVKVRPDLPPGAAICALIVVSVVIWTGVGALVWWLA